MMSRKRACLICLAALALVIGAFFVGNGLGKVTMNVELRRSYTDSSVEWRQELAAGTANELVRDQRNRELIDCMHEVSINQVLRFANSRQAAEADIGVGADSKFGCTVTIIRDATGEALYKSDLIDPGHYIKEIRLSNNLRKGYYPCTVVWSYYTAEDEYVGETATKIVVVVDN